MSTAADPDATCHRCGHRPADHSWLGCQHLGCFCAWAPPAAFTIAVSPAAPDPAVSEVQCIEKAARAAWVARYNALPESWDCAPEPVQEAWRRAARAVIKVYEGRPPPSRT